jgi:pimeloyl-ACP methyl ester carboxylesterase
MDSAARIGAAGGKGIGWGRGRLLKLAPLLLPLLAGAGTIYQGLAAARDRRRYPAPGRLVNVAGKRLHFQESGCGSPTVLLETGLGGMSCAWGWIQPEVARFARVVSYDRPGLGWSDPEPHYPSAWSRVATLHAALAQAGIGGPYLLVGHSMGGMLVRVFHHLFPEEVAGVLLIDAAHPDQHLKSPAIGRHMSSGFRMLRNVQPLAKIGYLRLSDFFASQAEGLPQKELCQARSFLCAEGHLRQANREAIHWDELCAEVRVTGSLGDKPLTVLSAGKGALPGGAEMQRDLARLSSKSREVVVDGADHVTLVTHREHALKVVAEIRRLVESFRGQASGEGLEQRLA